MTALPVRLLAEVCEDNANQTLSVLAPCRCRRPWWRWRGPVEHAAECKATRALDADARRLRETARLVLDGPDDGEAERMLTEVRRIYVDTLNDWGALHPGRVRRSL